MSQNIPAERYLEQEVLWALWLPFDDQQHASRHANDDNEEANCPRFVAATGSSSAKHIFFEYQEAVDAHHQYHWAKKHNIKEQMNQGLGKGQGSEPDY